MLAKLLAWLTGRGPVGKAAVGASALGLVISGSMVVFPDPTPAGGWPSALTTGVPSGITPSTYTGGCTISSGTVTIDAKDIRTACPPATTEFTVTGTATVTVTNSRIGIIHVTGTSARATVTDSDVYGGSTPTLAAIGVWNGPSTGYAFVGRRLNISGGKNGVECDFGCDVQDSYHHDLATPPSGVHMQGFLSGGSAGATDLRILLRHNVWECKVLVPGDPGGCTADVSLFGDYSPVSGVTVDGNLFKDSSTQSAYCAALGYNPGKNFPNPSNVVFTNNVFEPGSTGKCGQATPTAFWKRAADGATGNVWSGNKYVDGTPIPEPASG